MDVDGDADILSRLGILQSTLKSPHRKPLSQAHSQNDNICNENDADSSSSENCLFENERISISRSRIFSRQHNEEDTLNIASSAYPNFVYAIFLTFFAAFFECYTIDNNLLHGDYYILSQFLFIRYLFYMPIFFVGLFIASNLYSRFNVTDIFVCLLFLNLIRAIAMFLDPFLVNFITLLVGVGLSLAVIQSGCLLIAMLPFRRRNRKIFMVAAALALAALVNSLREYNTYDRHNSIVLYASSHSPIELTYYTPSFVHSIRRREIFGFSNATLDRVPADTRTTTRSTPVPVDEKIMPAVVWTNATMPVESNDTLNATNATESSTTTDINNRVFKTKTEENRVMREEAERKRKAKEKEEQQKAATTTTPAATTTLGSATTNSTMPSAPAANANDPFVPTLSTVDSHTVMNRTPLSVSTTMFKNKTVGKTQLITVRRTTTNSLGNGEDGAQPKSNNIHKNNTQHFSTNGRTAPTSSFASPSPAPSLSSNSTISSGGITRITIKAAISQHQQSQKQQQNEQQQQQRGVDVDQKSVKKHGSITSAANNNSTASRLCSLALILVTIALLCAHFYTRLFGTAEQLAEMRMCLADELESKIDLSRVEAYASCSLSLLVWTAQFAAAEAVTRQIRFCAVEQNGAFNQLYQFLPVFWTILTIIFCFLLLWDNRFQNAKITHLIYALALSVCLIFDHGVELSAYSSTLMQFFFMGIAAGLLPWLVLVWLKALTRARSFAIVWRFCASAIIGRIVAATFIYLNSSHHFKSTQITGHTVDNWRDCMAMTAGPIYAFVVVALLVSYALFVILSYAARRADRQRQIIQLSEEINGRQRKNSTYQTRNKRRRRRAFRRRQHGQYTALVDEEHIDCHNNSSNRRPSAGNDSGTATESENDNVNCLQTTTDDAMSDVEARFAAIPTSSTA